MNRPDWALARSASTAVMLPIAGLLGGLFVGGVRVWGGGADEFVRIARVVRWGITGFFAGLALVTLLAFASRRRYPMSTRKRVVLVVVAGLLAWFFARVLTAVLGDGGY